ncbi:MAG: chromosome segregation protein SMC [Hyphomicrobiales bacterium]
MHFDRLRLSGFKSFIEPTELIISRGLTGVVGPNGCGKSNLLEALRWVMGESSYKSMRASGMDDVIFNGSVNRPQRNMAEVTVVLDNEDRIAPPGFNDDDVLEVTRRIEREAGSAYRINGKDARARDVQLLFADASTGSRSPALVRQGQISELISAKPQARRRILEEAAGITGLHTRRHEAELKLKGAETNLTRLEDVVGQLEQQLAGLKRQARQASRYKNLSGHIRRHEAAQLYLGWKDADNHVQAAAQEFDAAVRALGLATKAASEAGRAQLNASEKIPALRDHDTARSAVVQRLKVELERLEEEERRADGRRHELKSRLEQIAQDMERERELITDNDTILERLSTEEGELAQSLEGGANERANAAKHLQAAADTMARAQEAFDEASSALSELSSRRITLERSCDSAQGRITRLESDLADVERKWGELDLGDGIKTAGANFEADIASAEKTAHDLEAALSAAETATRDAREGEAKARAEYDDARRTSDNLSTEVRTLTKLLNVADGELWPPLIDALKVDAGYETALGAALGDDLDAASDENAPVHWSELPTIEANPLPGGAKPLSSFVNAPKALARRLDQIGVVEPDQGKGLQTQLKPGQRLVSLKGDLWRWDGFVAASEAPTAAAKRLAERNRLGDLQEEASAASKHAEETRAVHEQTRAHVEQSAQNERDLRSKQQHAGVSLNAARKALSAHERETSEQTAKAGALEEARRRLQDDLMEARETHKTASAEFAALAPLDNLETNRATALEQLERERTVYSDARAAHDGLERDASSRQTRLTAISNERSQWHTRLEKAKGQIETLEARAGETSQEVEKLDELPGQWTEQRKKLMRALSDAEEEKKASSDTLTEAETQLAELTRTEREAQELLSEARESHARLEARLEAARERLQETEGRITEVLECAPQGAFELAEFKDGEDLPQLEDIEIKLGKLKAERERLGGVNLRADEEAEEVGTQIEELVAERDDLISAIHKLRYAIGSLNKEARERLLGAFDTVNENFRELFTKLFNGGQAELKLIESEDPLESGLEIFARPPGKRTQTMSLLSGGEQALTATALIFAVFLTNPSPICVLDEVDAPLDDANVERFCNLLDEMASKTTTRFLVITHHPLTMSRMNRLFGVTMMEKGVSQLVSVDLEAAEQLREAG